MKKIVTFALVLLFVSAVSFAVAGSFDLGSNNNKKTVQLSNNVVAAYDGGGDGSSYVAATVNPKADDRANAYLVTSESGATYYKSFTDDNITASDLPDFDNGTVQDNTWKAL